MGKTDMLPQLTNLMSGLLGTLTFFKNVFIGIIIAIYVLNSKQLFAAQAKIAVRLPEHPPRQYRAG